MRGKEFFLILVTISLVDFCTCWGQIRCRTAEYEQNLRAQPGIESVAAFEQSLAQTLARQRTEANARAGQPVYRIPVVVHIVHRGEPVGVRTNLPDAQVHAQIAVLNQDFRRAANSRGYSTDPRSADPGIEFILARRDPAGNPTDGIRRIAAAALGITDTILTEAQVEAGIKPNSIWDATRYLNIWVLPLKDAASGAVILGYAQPPILSGLGGFACREPGRSAANTDGIVVNYKAFGTQDAAPWPLIANAEYGRTATHEVGHWLGLRHIWGDDFCGTDYTEDTPVHHQPNQGCPTHPRPNSCGTPDELFENYMDYTADACMQLFTQEQALRMRAVLTTAPRRRDLLTSPALTAPAPADLALVQWFTPLAHHCRFSYSALVVVRNAGTAAINGYTLQLRSGISAPVSATQALTAPLPPGGVDTIVIGPIILDLGQQIVTCTVLAVDGQPDTATANNNLATTVWVDTGLPLPLAQSFEDGDTWPDRWQATNPNADCWQWRRHSVPAGPYGTPTMAARMALYQNTAPSTFRDELYTPILNLAGPDTSAYLSFYLAHARLTATSAARLLIEVSTDCGLTWEPTTIYDKRGSALVTAPAPVSQDYYPSQASHWRREVVNLRPWIGQTIRLRFVALNTGGNNLFLDDFLLSRTPRVPTPTISSFEPDSGAPGALVRLRGTGLAATGAITFGGQPAQAWQSNTDTALATTVPVGAVTGAIRVLTPGGEGATTSPFRVLQKPIITQFAPTVGPPGQAVTLTGLHFWRVRRAYVNGTRAAIRRQSATELQIVVPAGATSGKLALVTPTDSVWSQQDFEVSTDVVLYSGADTLCGVNLRSPGYPASYGPNLATSMTLLAPAERQTILQFTDFDTESPFDVLRIYDGTRAAGSPLLATLEGRPATLPTFTSTRGGLTLVFTTDNSTSGRGFRAQVGCTALPPPAIGTFSPRQGPVGHTFGLTGLNLHRVDTVWFGRIPVTAFTRTPTSLSGLVPPGAISTPLVLSAPTGRDTTAQPYIVTDGPAYCPPRYNNCFPGQGLRTIRLEGTGLRLNLPCTDASGPAYTIWPTTDSSSGVLRAGGLQILHVGVAPGQQVGAWLDINRNGIFEPTEHLPERTPATPAGPATILMQVPAGLAQGPLAMRVRSRVSVAGADACTGSSTGSAADFTLQVLPCAPVAPPVVLRPDTLCLGDTARLQAQGQGVPTWFEGPTGNGLLDTGQTFRPVPTSTTVFYVAMLSGSCLSPRLPIEARVSPQPQADFTASGAQLRVAPQSLGPGHTFQWLLDGQPIPFANSLTHLVLQQGSYSLRVTNADGCTAVSPSQRIAVTAGSRSAAGSFSVRPNPTQGLLWVEGLPPSTPIRLLNELGQVLWQGTPEGTISLAGLPAGLYMLQATGHRPVRVSKQ